MDNQELLENVPGLVHISTATERCVNYIEGRRSGHGWHLRTR